MSVQALFSGCFFFFLDALLPIFIVLNPSNLLAYLPVLPWAGGVAGELDVVVDGWATVDVDAASDNFVATRHLIHACCASVKDRGSASAGSGIAMCWLGLANIECFRQHRNQRPAVD